ncbi:unnamed protein product [Miscanthus lutarioriparius]|uniref:F-box domain-containing protein n=1 Tax=Miscanthus lutarioriparius TaxID=422564 RepID=A0A811N3S9_9POAL|nr:unnamed protein product [Miscanthus lutarioriparius]
MAPPPPPELMDDLIGEILLRLPPKDPACLVRASLICKPWHRLLSDGAFLLQYSTFHQTPPASPVSQPAIAVASGPTTSCYTLDCRHGRVLFQAEDQPSQTLTVWDPITGNHKRISPPMHQYAEFSAAVLCASDGCNHLGCNGGLSSWLSRAYIMPRRRRTMTRETQTEVLWDGLVSTHQRLSLLVRDAIYFILENGEKSLKYGLLGGVLSVINAPPQHEPNMIFATAHDGELGAATVEFYSLHLWSWRATDPDDSIGEWTVAKFSLRDIVLVSDLVTARLQVPMRTD